MLSWMQELLNQFLGVVLSVLPQSPFQRFIDIFRDLPYLGYLNWFFPIGDMILVGTVWLSAIIVFYVWSVVMRWIKLLGD